MRRLIADSGSTKTDWCLTEKGSILFRTTTEGINPFHQTQESIRHIVAGMHASTPPDLPPTRVEFYGAGCALPDKQMLVRQALEVYFPSADIRVESDLLGAARAACQGEPGIACILGTGSNSCQFDGNRIVANTPSLGYILGDEGSGAVLGRTLVSDWLKGQLPAHVCRDFEEEYHLTQAELLERVYRQPLANRFLASFTPFLHKHRHEPSVHALLTRCFQTFFRRNVLAYDHTLPIHFIGSIAHYFREEVTEAAQSLSLTAGRFMRTPMEGLIECDF